MDTPEEAEQSALIETVMKCIERDRGLVGSKDDEDIAPPANMIKDIAKYDRKWLEALGTHNFPTVVPGMKEVIQDRRASAVVVLKALIILTMGDVAADGASSEEKHLHSLLRQNWNKVALESVGLCKELYKSPFEQLTLQDWEHWLTTEKINRGLENLDSSDDSDHPDHPDQPDQPDESEEERPAKKKQKRTHRGKGAVQSKKKNDKSRTKGKKAEKTGRESVSRRQHRQHRDEGVRHRPEKSITPQKPATESSSDDGWDEPDGSDGSNDGWLTAPLPRMHYETNSYQREMLARTM